MIITVVGLGFVGLTAAAGFASKGHTVYGVEKDPEKRDMISRGKLPFYEPHMESVLLKTLNSRLFICEDQSDAAGNSDCVFYCVGTPVGTNGDADLHFLFEAVRETLPFLSDEKKTALIVKSTVPAGTILNEIAPLICASGIEPGRNVELVSNPEFLREGNSWEDFMNPDRIVIGAMNEDGFDILKSVYSGFHAPFVCVSPTTAEFTKYLSNTMLATMISFSNEMSVAAGKIGDIDVKTAFRTLQKDRRWAENTMKTYLYPGCGYGGYCLPKDTQAMYYTGTINGAEMPLIGSVMETNEKIADYVADCLLEGCGKDSSIGILGLAFKPFTDDVRDTPSARVIERLYERGVRSIMAYDPMSELNFQKVFSDWLIRYPGSAEMVIEQCERTAILTAWPEFSVLTNQPGVMDFRYM